MFERMHAKGLPSHLLFIAGSSVIVGLLLSGFVLSASPAVGFAVVLATGAAVVAAVEMGTQLRKKGHNRPTEPEPTPTSRRARTTRQRERSHGEEANRDFIESEAELIQESWQ